jgi:glycosyltransferase involved in cell wall biosynthesis
MVPSILGMTGSLARHGDRVTIVTPTPCHLGSTPVPGRVELIEAEADLEGAVRSANVLHLHGLWQAHTRRGAAAARRADVPYMIAAHGMAEPWALRHKAIRKKVYTALIEGKNLRRASCLHALSRPEIGHLRALAPRTPIAWIPNGVDLAPFDELPTRVALEADHPELAGKFVLLFFGRLHVKKGLDLLSRAFATIARDWPELHLLLAGRDDGAWRPFHDVVSASGLTERVTYLGHVAGEAARRAWGAADAFILPSYSEGFSMAILEAMAARLPLVATTACHFPELSHHDAAIVVEPHGPGVLSGLRALHERSEHDRRQMALRGRRLAEERFTWDRQGRRLAEVYRWLSAGGEAPEAVEMAGGF